MIASPAASEAEWDFSPIFTDRTWSGSWKQSLQKCEVFRRLEFLIFRLVHPEPPGIHHSSDFPTLTLIPIEVSAHGLTLQ